ncbi:MAG: cobalamin-binding protein [Gammaproteobacteria bacterium]|jgi:iron complex transport system substrate-binding protein|nr:cobalamin-binding protein [Gammaproteobacteria bacterium]
MSEKWWIILLLLLQSVVATAQESGKVKSRIISLSPNLTEILFEIGAGEQIVGTVEYSNYPQAASQIPRVGRYDRLDLESIVSLMPDLIVAWESGNAPAELGRLRSLGFEVVVTEPQQLEAVAEVMEQLGRRIGVAGEARRRATAYRQRLQQIRERYRKSRPVRLFYEVWNQPLMTVNGKQIISNVVELCGGVNVFGALSSLSPRVSVEAVLEQDPEVIIASGMGSARPEWLDSWRDYPMLQAVQQDNLYHVPPDIIQRHGPRLVVGAERVCEALQTARQKRL